MSDARWYAVWPDLRSRSWALQSWKSGHFQKLSPAPFTNGAGYWPRILKLGHNNWLGQIFIFVLVFVSRDLSFAQTSVVKSRPSVPYGANLLLFIFCCPELYLLVQWPITSSVAAAAKGAVWPYTRHQCWRSWTWLTEVCVCVCVCVSVLYSGWEVAARADATSTHWHTEPDSAAGRLWWGDIEQVLDTSGWHSNVCHVQPPHTHADPWWLNPRWLELVDHWSSGWLMLKFSGLVPAMTPPAAVTDLTLSFMGRILASDAAEFVLYYWELQMLLIVICRLILFVLVDSSESTS